VEVVAVVGRTARNVPVELGWEYIAGLTAGQDISERALQRSGPAPQFGLAKSFPGFSPMGPALVTPDELEHPDDLGLGCEVTLVSFLRQRGARDSPSRISSDQALHYRTELRRMNVRVRLPLSGS